MAALSPWWRSSVINRRAWGWENDHQGNQQNRWWSNAVIYQINPWSYQDTNGDGIGDLQGIISRLDYVAALGVDAIWLSPIYKSPMKDMGYDICDMRAIDSQFGTLADFDQLVELAHSLDLKVIVDQVLNHTSDQHPWFVESQQSRDNPKADWYVWADAQADSSPPNNWRSAITGESAWAWSESRQQFYLHNFLADQPDLNWNNPETVDAILDNVRFWLERGVDGLRLDAVNFYIHDPELRDNPPRSEDMPLPDGVPAGHPLAEQVLKYSFCHDCNIEAIARIRRLVNEYPDVMTLGEIAISEDSVKLAGDYVKADEGLHLAYHTGLLADKPLTAPLLHQLINHVQENFATGSTCWIVGNHDYGRLKSRWCCQGGQPYPDAFYHMVAALLLTLPGAFCLYQGDELGLTTADIPEDISPEQLRDPMGQTFYPDIKGRDPSRTPMPWQAEALNAGFTTAKAPWLPIPQAHYSMSVDREAVDSTSLLNTWRRLLYWRQKQPALQAGNFCWRESDEKIVAFVREYAEQSLLCLFNLSDRPATYKLPADTTCEGVYLGFEFDRQGDTVYLPAFSVYFGELL